MPLPGHSKVSRRTFTRLKTVAAGTLAGGAALLGYGAFVEPLKLDIVRVAVPLLDLPVALGGLRIALISDLHVGSLVSARQLQAAVKTINDLSPSLVAITGDHAWWPVPFAADLLTREISQLRAPLGVYAVLGNHDYRVGTGLVSRALQRGGVTLLHNTAFALAGDGTTVYIAGVDDTLRGHPSLSRALRKVPTHAQVILLAHEPDFADVAAGDKRIVLQLSGHSHGGQIVLPGLPRYFPRLARKYPQGLRQVGQMWLYTNRGIGTVFPPLRINCRPEVTILEITGG